MVTAITNANAWGNFTLFKSIEALFQVLPEALSFAVGMLAQIGLGHSEWKYVNRDVALSLDDGGLSETVNFFDDGVRHGEASHRGAAAVYQDVRASARQRSIVDVGEAEIQ